MQSRLELFKNGNTEDILAYVDEIILCAENNYDYEELNNTADFIVRFNRLDILKYMVDANSKINNSKYFYRYFRSPNCYLLYIACHLGHLEIVKYLAQFSSKCQLENAIYNATTHYDIFEYLLSTGVNINKSYTKLLGRACEDGCCDVIRYLINIGIDIHGSNNMAFRMAYMRKRIDVLKILLDTIQDSNRIDDSFMYDIYQLINENRGKSIKNARY